MAVQPSEQETHSRFLLIEGEGRIRRLLSSMLQGAGARTVHSAPSGKAGREVLLREPVDAVVCDWSAPELSGMEFLKSVRDLPVTKYLPFLMMSRVGQLKEEELAATRDHDVDGHLFKPITPEDLQGKVRGAVERYNRMAKAYTHLARAAAFVDIGEKDEARREIREAQLAGADSARVWSEAGSLLTAMQAGDEAKQCHRRSIEIDRNYARAYDSLGAILEQEGNAEGAAQFFLTSARLSPRNKTRQFSLAKNLLAKGDVEEARAAVRRGIEAEGEISPQSARNAAAAEFFLAAGRADLAEEEYAFALEGDPANVHYFNRLGIAFRRQKKYQEAIENYRKALKVAPNDPVLHYNLALALAESGQWSQAVGTLRRALVLDPRFKAAEELLRRIEARAKQAR
ncbi:MAG: tetratricopeptide repeat protein [Nitrospinota bacterium]